MMTSNVVELNSKKTCRYPSLRRERTVDKMKLSNLKGEMIHIHCMGITTTKEKYKTI